MELLAGLAAHDAVEDLAVVGLLALGGDFQTGGELLTDVADGSVLAVLADESVEGLGVGCVVRRESVVPFPV